VTYFDPSAMRGKRFIEIGFCTNAHRADYFQVGVAAENANADASN